MACDSDSSTESGAAAKPAVKKPGTKIKPRVNAGGPAADKEPLEPGRIRVGNSNVTFVPPKGFKPLSKELIAAKWPNSRPPAYAVGTPSGGTTVAYDLKPNEIPQDKLHEVKKAFTRSFESRIPGVEWRKNEIIEHSGQKWLVMEMTSRAIDQDIHNIVLITPHKGKMLMFNFNSTKKDFRL